MHTTTALTNDDLAERLSCAGEVLQELSWHALDGTWPRLWGRECTTPPGERVTAALADIRRLGPILQDRVGAVR
jgi:hypothetical protein